MFFVFGCVVSLFFQRRRLRLRFHVNFVVRAAQQSVVIARRVLDECQFRSRMFHTLVFGTGCSTRAGRGRHPLGTRLTLSTRNPCFPVRASRRASQGGSSRIERLGAIPLSCQTSASIVWRRRLGSCSATVCSMTAPSVKWVRCLEKDLDVDASVVLSLVAAVQGWHSEGLTSPATSSTCVRFPLLPWLTFISLPAHRVSPPIPHRDSPVVK